MNRAIKTLPLIIIALFLLSACCGMPQSQISTKSNAGILKISATPDDADVYIDGVLQGKAREFDGRSKVLELTAGRHKIEIRAEGYHSFSRDIMVGAGAVDDVKVTLAKK